MQKIVFIGAGSMAEAIIGGWVNKGYFDAKQIFVSNRSDFTRLENLHNTYGVQILEQLSDLHDADLIILAMKPKDVGSAMQNIAPFISANAAILSVLAGISIKTIEDGLCARPIARVMPNTSATIGMSASGIAFNDLVTEEQKALFIDMLMTIGLVVEVEEDKLHAVTALSGSGPAYIYYLMEAFEKVGTDIGLPKDIVRQLMVQTLAGSASMLQSVDEEPDELRRKIMSPGGTTEAGIQALQDHHFTETIEACVKSAESRSRELAKGV
ncbi:pyrroline-5-carboxylate reductase [Lysinibacillus sp. KU-BSD001]|uniref:pyrroline-5-carboxylate reductase n=1 Tax=Lysinibacillus sp. KU-BSD001 TaxID=3141328 RepID=UPI0036E54DF4